MSTPTQIGRLETLAPISLDEMTAAADLLTRVDRKYVITPDQLEQILLQCGHELAALEIDGSRDLAYESVYFDTPDLESYRRAARSRRHRFKVRTRTYLSTNTCMLEVKVVGGRDETIKNRMSYSPNDRHRLTDSGRAFIAEYIQLPMAGRELIPMLTTRYRRATLRDGASRITIDADLVCTRVDGAELCLPNKLIVETKSAGPVTRVDRLLWSAQIRPVTISKHAVGLAGLDPSLPANKWNQVLRRHFGWTPVRINSNDLNSDERTLRCADSTH